MKKIYSRLLFIALIMGFLLHAEAQNSGQPTLSNNNSKLNKELVEIAHLYKSRIAINANSLDDFNNFTFRERNREVKVEIVPNGNISELNKALKNIRGVKVINIEGDFVSCWVEIDQLKDFSNNVNEIASVRPFLTNVLINGDKIGKKSINKGIDEPISFLNLDSDSEEENEEKEEREKGGWWSKERELYEFNLLVDPATGKIPRDAPLLAANAAVKAKNFSPFMDGLLTGTELTVVPRGPNNLGGRTRALGIDKRNSQIMMGGSVSSGLYRTTNGGTTWTRIAPIGQIHNVTALAQDTRAGFEDTWYYGTGETSGNSASIGSAYRGNGIWKSTDNGLTWSLLAATTGVLENFDSPFDYVHRIVVDPTNGNVYAAAGNSIQRSTNGGTTWSAVLGTFGNAGFTDILVTPGGRLYASFTGSDANEGVWTSTTGASASWTKIAGTISAVRTPATWNAAATYSRIVMGYAPSNPDVVFFLYHNGTTSSCATTAAPEAKLFKYVQSTGTFTDLSANLPDEPGCSNGNDPFAVQGGYDLLVAVKPDNENIVFVGGTNLYRSTSGFTNTTATTRIGGYNSTASYALYPNHHPDQHIVVFAEGDNNTIYSGNDGGIHKGDATAPTVVWTSLNNDYVTYQYYNVDIDPAMGSTTLMGGAQDNGTTAVTAGSNYSSVFGGDGCGTAIISIASPTSFNVIASSQSGNIVRLTGPSLGFGIRPIGLLASAFVTTFNLDQDNTNYLYFGGGAVLYRTRIARTITNGNVSGSASGWEILPAGISGTIQCWSTSRNTAYGGAAYTASDANRKLYIGTTTGRVYRLNDPAFSTSAAVEITPIAPIAASGVCSSIAVNPYDDNEIIITYANYGVRSVYHTLNANMAAPTWTVVEGPATGPVTLGSARASIITKIGSTKTYLVGNSTGLYSTQTLSGATTVWDRVGTNEINYALAANMRLRTSDNRIVLGTHGNGMFELQLAPAVNISSQPMAVTACSGSDVSFSVVAAGITNYKWQVSPDNNPANFVDITIAAPYSTTNGGATLNIAAITAALNGTYYRCVLTDAFSIASNSNSALLTVADPVDPTSVMSSSNNICVGGNISLTATCSVGTVTWYNVATAGTPIGTGSPFMQSPTVNNSIYYASCKAGACESNRIATSPVVITVIVNPTAVATDLTEICSGSSVSLSASCADAGVVVNWYGAATGGVALGTGSPFLRSPTANITYYASCKGMACESGRVATPLITVLPNLNAPTSTTQVDLKGTITTSDPLYNRANVFTIGTGTCALASDGVVFNYKMGTFTLNAASVVVASLLTADGGAIAPGNADTFLTLYSAFDPANPCANIVGINDDASGTALSKITTASLPAGTYTVVLSSYDPGAIAGFPWTYSIAVKTSAAALVSGSPPTLVKVNGLTTPVSIFNGDDVTLSAACNDGTITWYDAMTGGVALGTGSPFMVTPSMSKSYYVSCKNSCSETARVATQLITVVVRTFTADNNSPICESTSLNFTSSGGTSYAWTGPNSFVSSLQNPSIASATAAASGVYTVTISYGAGNTATATTSVTVVATPVASNAGPYIIGGTISLSASSGASYSWTGPVGFTNTLQNPTINNAQLINSGVYTVTVTNPGCVGTATTNVVVNSGIDPCVAIMEYYFVRTNYPAVYESLFTLTNGQNIAKNIYENSIIVKPICSTIPIKSVQMVLTGGPYNTNWTIMQNFELFTLFDDAGNILNGQRFPAGTFNLKVTGYAEQFGQGGITYGPVNTVFNIVEAPNTISVPTVVGTEFCAGTNINVAFTTTGLFAPGNIFTVLLSNANGVFDIDSRIIGSSSVSGSVVCTLPSNLMAGSNYKVKVLSSEISTAGINSNTGIKVNATNLALMSPVDDYSSGMIVQKAVEKIDAKNKVSGSARVDYKAGNAVNLTPGFQVTSSPGSSFKVNIEGCN